MRSSFQTCVFFMTYSTRCTIGHGIPGVDARQATGAKADFSYLRVLPSLSSSLGKRQTLKEMICHAQYALNPLSSWVRKLDRVLARSRLLLLQLLCAMCRETFCWIWKTQSRCSFACCPQLLVAYPYFLQCLASARTKRRARLATHSILAILLLFAHTGKPSCGGQPSSGSAQAL